MAEPPRLRLIAGLDDLAAIRRFVGGTAARGGGNPEAVADMLLAVNEAATNIIEHGYQGSAGYLEVEAEYDGDALMVRLLTDEMSYRAGSNGWNELVLVKKDVRRP
jgi:serine/threonine-protein kinase RsbW